MSKFIAASKQATKMDKTRIQLKTRRLKTTAGVGLKWQPRIQTRPRNCKTSSSKRTPILTIFRRGMMS